MTKKYKTIGIICEFNPLHNGHKYIMDHARKALGADRIILVMSGDYVQRGEPAIVSKEARTRMALESGADAVFELPLLYCASSAEYFARGAISVFNALGCIDILLFASEEGSLELLSKAADILIDEPVKYREMLINAQSEGLSYAAARMKALAVYFDKKETNFLTLSNNILAIEYLRALRVTGSTIQPVTIKRLGASYNNTKIHRVNDSCSPKNTASITASATAIRRAIVNSYNAVSPASVAKALQNSPDNRQDSIHDLIRSSMPQFAYDILMSSPRVYPNNFSSLLKYKLTLERDKGFAQYLDIDDDLSNKIRAKLPLFTDTESFIQLLKSKDLAYTRISRALLHIVLNIRSDLAETARKEGYPVYLRLLGLRTASSDILRSVSDDAPIISRLSDADKMLSGTALSLLRQNITASDIYHQINGDAVSDYSRTLIRL
ncbi:tRNA(Met) cytidine acetate ligase [Butyrivibrio sp. MC2013]|uniref:tRNA(Met) cytidine acetate ligase n=1 Tax=Butyrivibrio sp. MC2013 TaxID=1280686 RepID=UPI000405B78B|nr:nucleotidyltransferase family protein [Butyrivibrio sp. MC2013]